MIKELAALETDFNENKNSYEEFMKQTNALISESKIGKGFLFNLRDYEQESMGFKKGKEIEKLPAKTNDVYIYHFDEEKNIIRVDSYGSAPNIIDKEFCFQIDGVTLKTYYFNGGFVRLRNVVLSEEQNGKTSKAYYYGIYGVTFKQYFYGDDNLLDKIVVESKQHDKTEFEKHELIFKFDSNKILEKIEQSFPNGYRKILYGK